MNRESKGVMTSQVSLGCLRPNLAPGLGLHPRHQAGFVPRQPGPALRGSFLKQKNTHLIFQNAIEATTKTETNALCVRGTQ